MELEKGQQLVTDNEFREVIKGGTLVIMTQNNIRQRPISTIKGYTDEIVIFSDGHKALRSANVFHISAGGKKAN